MSDAILDRLVIPASQESLLRRSGLGVTLYDDVRRFSRRYLAVRALFEYCPSLPALQRPEERHAIVLLDISRGGCSFFHSEQLYPGESARLLLDHAERVLEIAWCRRLGEHCFQVGALFESER